MFIDDATLICEKPDRVETLNIQRNKNSKSFKLVKKQNIIFAGISQERSLFAVTKDKRVLAYCEITNAEALYQYKFGSEPAEFTKICDLILHSSDDRKTNYSACYAKENTILVMTGVQDIMFL